jgi:uncharacterized protein (DUF427 family)
MAKALEDTDMAVVARPPTDLLEPSGRHSTCPHKGEASPASVRAGDRVAQDAVWRHPDPIEGCPDISGHVALCWDAMDSWWEEDGELQKRPATHWSR